MILKNNIRNTIRILKAKHYQWNYWRSLVKNMRNQINEFHNISQEQNLPYINKPGIAFSFDDSFRVNDWYQYGKDMFGFYDVKVTFNINAFHHFENQREHTQKEIDMLLELQSNGHEIAHHGFQHRSVPQYIQDVGLRKWVEDEIISLFNWMEEQKHSRTKEKFKKPVSFAFPYFYYKDNIIKEIIPNYFKIVRGHLNGSNLTQLNHTGLAPSICIDSNILVNAKYVRKILKIVKKSGCSLILTCHSILPDNFNWEDFEWQGKGVKQAGRWRISPKKIQSIINFARKIDLEFYTTSEIAGVATFIDQNFEKYVKEKLSNPNLKWISIHELLSIKELDISNKNITNLGGLQYFLNLEKIILNNDQLNNPKLIHKLPKLKEVEVNSTQGIKKEII